MMTAHDPRWARIVARDKTADGHLWYSVSTTGVYCRPSCPSRIATPKNVQLHDSLESARATGFRPCKRCKPDQPSIAAALRRRSERGLRQFSPRRIALDSPCVRQPSDDQAESGELHRQEPPPQVAAQDGGMNRREA